MTELIRLTAAELSSRLQAKTISAVEVTQAHLDQIAAVDTDLHAFLHVAADSALATAAHVDARRAAGDKLGPLAGVPIAIKDVLTTLDMPTTAGSKILDGWVPPYDATVVTKLQDAGAVTLGVRPEHIELSALGPYSGSVQLSEHLGSDTYFHVDAGELGRILVRAGGETLIKTGDTIRFGFDTKRIHRFNANGIAL